MVKRKKKTSNRQPIGIVIGIAALSIIGGVVGMTVFDNTALAVGLGFTLGLGFAFVYESNTKKK